MTERTTTEASGAECWYRLRTATVWWTFSTLAGLVRGIIEEDKVTLDFAGGGGPDG